MASKTQAVKPTSSQQESNGTHAHSLFNEVMARLDIATEKLKLSEHVTAVLRNPAKQVIVSLPVSMDDGRVEVFQGYRIVHSTALGPSKGGIRYAMDVDLDEVKALA